MHASAKWESQTSSWKRNVPIKTVHKTIKLPCTHRPCGSDCTSHSFLCLPLTSSIASSLLWSPSFSFHRPHSCGFTHTQTLPVCVCFLHLSCLPSLPGHHPDFDLHHRLAHPFPLSCSSFAVHLSSSPMHLMSVYLCSPLASAIADFLITYAHIPALANRHHLMIYCSLCSQARGLNSNWNLK